MFSILSIKHFSAYQQVEIDYSSILIYQSELMHVINRNSPNYLRIKDEIITLLERIITNKNFLNLNVKADEDYLLNIKNDEF